MHCIMVQAGTLNCIGSGPDWGCVPEWEKAAFRGERCSQSESCTFHSELLLALLLLRLEGREGDLHAPHSPALCSCVNKEPPCPICPVVQGAGWQGGGRANLSCSPGFVHLESCLKGT